MDNYQQIFETTAVSGGGGVSVHELAQIKSNKLLRLGGGDRRYGIEQDGGDAYNNGPNTVTYFSIILLS